MRKKIIFICFITSFLISCSDNKKGDEALSLYNIAQEYYLNAKLDSANIIIDPLNSNYSSIQDVKYLTKTLQQSIAKDKSMYAIDSLSDIINEHKIRKLRLTKDEAVQEKINLIQLQIDSLEKQKVPFREIYNNIRDKELNECKQCVVYMRNTRK